eukprot:1006279-Amphidinium_carterae.1
MGGKLCFRLRCLSTVTVWCRNGPVDVLRIHGDEKHILTCCALLKLRNMMCLWQRSSSPQSTRGSRRMPALYAEWCSRLCMICAQWWEGRVVGPFIAVCEVPGAAGVHAQLGSQFKTVHPDVPCVHAFEGSEQGRGAPQGLNIV